MKYFSKTEALDFLGNKPFFLINNSSKNKTKFGGLLSLIITILVFAGTTYFLQILFSRSKYYILQNEEYYQYSYRNWKPEDFSIILLNATLSEIPDLEKTVGITGTWWESINEVNHNGEKVDKLFSTSFELEKCNVGKHFISYSDLWKNEKYINQSMCLPYNSFYNSSRVFASDNYTGLVIWVHRCQNTTDKHDCYSVDKINQILENVFVVVKIKDYYFDHSLIKHNAVPFVFTDTQSVSSTAFKRIWYIFREVNYIIDKGYFFPDETNSTYTNLASIQTSVDLRMKTTIAQSIAAVSLNMNSMKTNYSKFFYKCQNMIADVGGLLKALVSLAGIINHYFSSNLYYYKILDANINFMMKTPNPNIGINSSENKRKFEESKIGLNINNIENDFSVNAPRQINNYITPRIVDFSFSCQKNNIGNSKSSSLFPQYKMTETKQNESEMRLNFKNRQIFLCSFCFKNGSKSRSNVILLNKFFKLIKKQLEITNIISKINNIELVNYLLLDWQSCDPLKQYFNPFNLEQGDEIPTNLVKLKEEVIKKLVHNYEKYDR